MYTNFSAGQKINEMKSILAVQSHVVHGFVGNKSATFPLQTLGWNVDAINTVQFSNHTGYGSFAGHTITTEQMADIFRGLKEIECSYDAFLSGYIPNADLVSLVGKTLSEWKTESTLRLLDPVMGDEGELYVNPDVVPAYQAIIAEKGNVDIITPNQYECELLTGTRIETKLDLVTALDQLHKTVPYVVISSLKGEILGVDSREALVVVVSSEQSKFWLQVPLIDSYFTGVGDLFSALLVDRFVKYGAGELVHAVNDVLSVMSRVLGVTKELAGPVTQNSMGDPAQMKNHELRIIECRNLYDVHEERFPVYQL